MVARTRTRREKLKTRTAGGRDCHKPAISYKLPRRMLKT